MYTVHRASRLLYTCVWPGGPRDDERFRLYEVVDHQLVTQTNDEGCRPGRRQFPALEIC